MLGTAAGFDPSAEGVFISSHALRKEETKEI
jgi:hypothetical protein